MYAYGVTRLDTAISPSQCSIHLIFTPLSPRNQAKQLAGDGKHRPAEAYGTTMENHVAKQDDHERHHREHEEARRQLQGHDEGIRHMQTRSQSQNVNAGRQKDPKVRGELKQPGGGGRGKY